MKMGKGTSIKEAWQEFRAKTTNQVVVRDCQTQTPNEQTVLSAAEAAKNQTNNLDSRAQQEKAWIAVYNATSQVVNLERHAEDAWIAVYNATSQVVNLERHTKHTSPAKELELQEAKKVAMYVGGGIAAAAVIGVLSFVAAPVALAAAGFTTAGIVAGSTGASMMSAAAIANGGGIAAGSVVAMLQSAGAAGGIAASTCAGIGIGTAAAGTAIAAAVEVAVSQVRYVKKPPKDPGNPPVDVGTQTDNDSTDTATKTDDDGSTDCITETDDSDDD